MQKRIERSAENVGRQMKFFLTSLSAASFLVLTFQNCGFSSAQTQPKLTSQGMIVDYSWKTNEFGLCENGKQERRVRCENIEGQAVDHSFCERNSAPPTAVQDCWSKEIRSGGFKALIELKSGSLLTARSVPIDNKGIAIHAYISKDHGNTWSFLSEMARDENSIGATAVDLCAFRTKAPTEFGPFRPIFCLLFKQVTQAIMLHPASFNFQSEGVSDDGSGEAGNASGQRGFASSL